MPIKTWKLVGFFNIFFYINLKAIYREFWLIVWHYWYMELVWHSWWKQVKVTVVSCFYLLCSYSTTNLCIPNIYIICLNLIKIIIKSWNPCFRTIFFLTTMVYKTNVDYFVFICFRITRNKNTNSWRNRKICLRSVLTSR